jgi:hypothetical protein
MNANNKKRWMAMSTNNIPGANPDNACADLLRSGFHLGYSGVQAGQGEL